ncbi:hypothetical protein NM208_g9403 [Fusarium decemcellulare]|uniref:Uncharacterized protein n=1 Tax=Fusarium decemcellulare TaxID=57161 RepID=A0ACC1S1P4_9HYPO|nr:hypothetical protein NM208_g9403 [Fusarium decemcellulare]
MADTSRKRKKNKSTPKPNNKATPPFDCFENIAPEGDVVFVLTGKTRVRVNSAIMRAVSPVFNLMLGPNFKEGHALAAATNGTSVEIPLPDDDDEAFGWICRALHCQADTNLWLPQLAKLVQVLELADKYAVIKAIELSVDFWIRKSIEMIEEALCGPGNSDMIHYWHLSLACYRVHASKSFELVTRELILNQDRPSFFELASTMESEPKTSQLASARVIYRLAWMLEEKRASFIRKGADCFHSEIPVTLGACPKASKEIMYDYLYTLFGHCIRGSDIYTSKLCCILYCCRDIPPYLWPHECDDEKRWSCAACLKFCYESIRDLQDLIEHQLKGLCLTCFDHSKTSECTDEHEAMKAKEKEQVVKEWRDEVRK